MTTTDDENRHASRSSSDGRLDASVNRSDLNGEYRAGEETGMELPG
jgi:hypothetical protein